MPSVMFDANKRHPLLLTKPCVIAGPAENRSQVKAISATASAQQPGCIASHSCIIRNNSSAQLPSPQTLICNEKPPPQRITPHQFPLGTKTQKPGLILPARRGGSLAKDTAPAGQHSSDSSLVNYSPFTIDHSPLTTWVPIH